MSNDDRPVEGDTFECETCGMQILVTTDCKCEDGAAFFSCCGAELSRIGDRDE